MWLRQQVFCWIVFTVVVFWAGSANAQSTVRNGSAPNILRFVGSHDGAGLERSLGQATDIQVAVSQDAVQDPTNGGEELPVPQDEPTLQIRGISDLTGLIEFYRARRGVNVLLTPDQQTMLSKYRIEINPEFQFPESDLDELLVQLLRLYGLAWCR